MRCRVVRLRKNFGRVRPPDLTNADNICGVESPGPKKTSVWRVQACLKPLFLRHCEEFGFCRTTKQSAGGLLQIASSACGGLAMTFMAAEFVMVTGRLTRHKNLGRVRPPDLTNADNICGVESSGSEKTSVG